MCLRTMIMPGGFFLGVISLRVLFGSPFIIFHVSRISICCGVYMLLLCNNDGGLSYLREKRERKAKEATDSAISKVDPI